LALPATLLLKALLVDADPKARWVNILIASDPRTAHTPVH
ncbi:AI-2E family transporter, partial [Burkholderia multivorans]